MRERRPLSSNDTPRSERGRRPPQRRQRSTRRAPHRRTFNDGASITEIDTFGIAIRRIDPPNGSANLRDAQMRTATVTSERIVIAAMPRICQLWRNSSSGGPLSCG